MRVRACLRACESACCCICDAYVHVHVCEEGDGGGRGHPRAATGTRLLLSLGHELRRSGGGLGVATACIGGGQGIAVVIESI